MESPSTGDAYDEDVAEFLSSGMHNRSLAAVDADLKLVVLENTVIGRPRFTRWPHLTTEPVNMQQHAARDACKEPESSARGAQRLMSSATVRHYSLF